MPAVEQWCRERKIWIPLLTIQMVVIKPTIFHLASGVRQKYVVLESQICRMSVGWVGAKFGETSYPNLLEL